MTSEVNDVGVGNGAIRDVDGEGVGGIAITPLGDKEKIPRSVIGRSSVGRSASTDQQDGGKS
jgi:hypothetical protein